MSRRALIMAQRSAAMAICRITNRRAAAAERSRAAPPPPHLFILHVLKGWFIRLLLFVFSELTNELSCRLTWLFLRHSDEREKREKTRISVLYCTFSSVCTAQYNSHSVHTVLINAMYSTVNAFTSRKSASPHLSLVYSMRGFVVLLFT